LGLRPPDPAGRAYSAPQTPYLDLKGLLLREVEGGEGWDGRGQREWRERKGREETIPSPFLNDCKP